jgi:phage-related protein
MENKHKQRTIIFYKDYFEEFFVKQREKVKAKIIWTLELIEELERVPETYLKHLENTDGLYEIRIQQGSDIFRIFCFFDQGQLIILTNGFQKKTQKTPKKEIEKALKIKNEYDTIDEKYKRGADEIKKHLFEESNSKYDFLSHKEFLTVIRDVYNGKERI